MDAATLLVCVWYRVAAADAARANALAREFQRTLAGRFGGLEGQVLLRLEPPPVRSLSDVPSVPAAAPEPSSADATLMETYRFVLPAAPGSSAADAATAGFLAALDAAAAPLAALLRGPRHLELFAPCAS